MTTAKRDLGDPLGWAPLRLGDLADEATLGELCASAEELFGIPVRIRPATPARAESESMPEPPDEGPGARTPPDGALHTFVVEHDGEPLAHVVLGPYAAGGEGLLATGAAGPATGGEGLLAANSAGEATPSRVPWVPATAVTIERIERHLRGVLGLLLASGHKAWLTSRTHVAWVRESHRDLSAKAAELDLALARLGELERLKSSFLATMSHELRTPLTSIIGYSEMLAEGIGGALSEEQHDFVQTVRAKSVHLLDLIMKLLDLSRLEGGAASLAYAETPLEEIVAEVTSSLAQTATRAGVTLDLDAASEGLLVLGDHDRIRQIVRHLVENAIKFTSRGGSVLVETRLVSQSLEDGVGHVLLAPILKAAEVRVGDTGSGVPEPERHRIFEPFFQVDQSSTREHGGAGLGLAIVKRLVEAHAGSIHVEANEPHGSVFVVRLPIARSPDAQPAQDA